MVIKFSRLVALGVSSAALAFAATAHAQCDPSVCANPAAYQNLPTTLAPRTFSTLKAAKAYCRSEPIVWRATAGGEVYTAKAKGFGKIRPGFYMCRSHAEIVARVNAKTAAKPR
ncbi:hypothetical protein ASD79_19315 [Caulobacter sp. Root655]|uniref:hypothetical protein n=1 Tax=Caulobacter sp. Root655 TaxID=1736578 RepID=UPI0006F520C7|nr:hypothetical protein [Caulobacter sp. Root655]KRA65075.1 hypothetical protein ASD79_19315 [Caulobacter sp. Root655]